MKSFSKDGSLHEAIARKAIRRQRRATPYAESSFAFWRRSAFSTKACLFTLLLAACATNLCAQQSSDPKDAYLMVYFTDQDHSLHLAVSYDGYAFTAVNDNYAIVCGDSISAQHGVRDPYIMQRPDGTYVMAATDLHINAQREGKRDTQWERGQEYGWGNNRSLVILQSNDLIHWTHNLITVADLPGYEDIGCAWAPEMLWDDEKGAMLIYWTMRFFDEANKVYYAYLNDDLTALCTEPTLIMELPHKGAYIDADILQGSDGKWYMTYVSHQTKTPGIKVAVADSPTGPYEYRKGFIDEEELACEAPNVWRRYGTDTYVLMYDCYGINPPNFGFLETEDFQTFRNIGHFNDSIMLSTNFSRPKHGAVVPITRREGEQLMQYWQEHPDHTTAFQFRQPRRPRPERPEGSAPGRPDEGNPHAPAAENQ